MKRLFLLLGCLSLLGGAAMSQELTISGFPAGIGKSAGPEFFEPYRAGLQAIADSLDKHPLSQMLITGSADSERYRKNNDAMNPALALGRAHALRNYMVQQFGINTDQVQIRTEETSKSGPEFRFVRVELTRELADLEIRLNNIENTPPPPAPPKEVVTIREVPVPIEQTEVKMHLGAGLSTSPFGGLPIATAAVSWDDRFILEGVVGHSFWNTDYTYQDSVLSTKRRMLGGQAIYYPKEDFPIGIVGGWVRIEQMARDYYEYVRLSEGLMVGLRWNPVEYVAVTGVYNPSKHHLPEFAKSETKNGQFLLSVAVNASFGGNK